ncbi:hypothetical protein AAC387_Pa09g0462 [Persea americana]
MVEASVMASATYPAGIFHEQGLCRTLKEFPPLPFVSCQSTKQDILRSSCLKLGSTHIEDQWKSAHLLAESNQSVIIDSTVRRPVLVDVQDVRSDSVVFSFGIAEQCARHEKILQYLMSGSKAEVEGFNFSVLSNLMGLHTVAIDMRQLSTHPTEDEFCLYEIDGNDHHSFLYEKSGFYGPKPLLDFVGDLGRSSMVSVHLDGRVLFTGTGKEVKDLISIVSEFYPLKSPMNCSKQALLVPHFMRNTMDGDAAQVSVMSSSLKLQTVTVAPVKSPEKIKLKPLTKKKHRRKAVRERDLYKKNYFHACESLLSVLVHKRHGKATILSLKKSGPELPQLLTQFSAGIAGTGLAVIFSVICKTIGGRAPFCTTKLLNTGFGLGLVWLSCAVNRLRETIIHISKNSSRVGSNENEIIRKVDRSVDEIFLRAAVIMAVAVLRFA